MDYRSMLSFLTEDSIKAHIAYVRDLRLRHSIEEKSLPAIKGKSALEISRMNIAKSLKRQIVPRLFDIELHLLYFDSFTDKCTPCPEIKKYFSSEDALCYEILRAARDTEYGFVYLTRGARGVPEIKCSSTGACTVSEARPLIALDVSEHAYFRDYGFERESYLRAALSHLKLSKLFPPTKKTP